MKFNGVEIENVRAEKILVPARGDKQVVLDTGATGYEDPIVILGTIPAADEDLTIWAPSLAPRWISSDEFVERLKGARLIGNSTLWFRNKGSVDVEVDLRIGGKYATTFPYGADHEATARWYRSNVWKSLRWMGIPVLKCPNDLWVAQEIISQLRPDVILETGTFYGGSAAFYATVLDGIDKDGRVVTIDIDARHKPEHPKIKYISGSSTDPVIVASVTKACAGANVLIFLDSDHSREHVLAELKAYSGLVPIGSFVVVEDMNFPGPSEAVVEFLASPEGKSFVRDRNCERLGTSLFHGGWLRREGGL